MVVVPTLGMQAFALRTLAVHTRLGWAAVHTRPGWAAARNHWTAQVARTLRVEVAHCQGRLAGPTQNSRWTQRRGS